MKCISKIKLVNTMCFVSLIASGQMTVDLGNDTTYCLRMFPPDTHYIGTNLIIENGQPPYTYAWDCKVILAPNLIFSASDFLNDTTIETPFFIDMYPFNTWIKYILHVKDNINNIIKDSINIRFSNFGYSTIEYNYDVIIGDSIQFDGINYIGGGIPPLKFSWQPTYGLSDPNSLYSWCKPDSSAIYYQIATDSAGCLSSPNPVYRINVLTTELDKSGAGIINNTINPVQTGKWLIFNNPQKKKAFIILYKLNGQQFFSINTLESSLNIGQFISDRGIFIVKVSIDNKIGTTKFMKF